MRLDLASSVVLEFSLLLRELIMWTMNWLSKYDELVTLF